MTPPYGADPVAYQKLRKFYGKGDADEILKILHDERKSTFGQDFLRVGNEIGSLVREKNEAYGDSFAKACIILEALYPKGVQPSQYRDMLGVTRIIDKLFRIATRKDAFGESPWRDIAGYGVVATVADERQKRVIESSKNDGRVRRRGSPARRTR